MRLARGTPRDALLAACLALLLGLGRAARGNREVCLLPAEVGPCQALIHRWYYNQNEATCLEFNYSGCKGNANNFYNKRECELTCNTKIKSIREICLLPPEEGPCEALLPRWYYNQDVATCLKFNYGGCRGNSNNFYTKRECQQSCNTMIKNNRAICLLPRKVGPCKAIMPRWYYDPNAATCLEFHYGGCKGNGNNFDTEEECEQTCDVVNSIREICLLPAEEGPCMAIIPRWYYDQNAAACRKFNYGGCRGNSNNFDTKRECQRSCNVMIKRRATAEKREDQLHLYDP